MSIVNVGIQFGTLLFYLKAKTLDKVIIAQGILLHIKVHIHYKNISYMFECRSWGGGGAGRNVGV